MGSEAVRILHIFIYPKLLETLGLALLTDSRNLWTLIARETTSAHTNKERGGVDGNEVKTEEIKLSSWTQGAQRGGDSGVQP